MPITYKQKLTQQAEWLSRVALTRYQRYLNWEKPEDYQLMLQEIKQDLKQRNIINSFYVRVALQNYQTDLQHKFEAAILAEDLDNANQQDAIAMIEKLFQYQIV